MSKNGQRLRLFVLAAAIGMAAGADLTSACSMAPPNREDIPIARWVAKVDQIVVARVVGMRERGAVEVDQDYGREISPTGTYEFTLETVERIKGEAPARFTVNGRTASSAENEEMEASYAHRRLGRFWLYFSPEEGGTNAACQFAPSLAFGPEYLIFRNKDGGIERLFGRSAQVVAGRDDPWLLAIKRMVAEPARKYGRSATVPEVLASSTFLLEGTTHKCWPRPGPPPPSPSENSKPLGELTGHKITRQLWGKHVEHTGKLDGMMWSELGKCEIGERRLYAIFSDGYFNANDVAFKVVDGIVDFTGLANGTEQGLLDADGRYGIWYSQIKLTGKLIWSVDELAAVMRRIAAGTYQADERGQTSGQ